jgi:predicted  nucleic acid-binding Zn-ribbon protein
MEKTMTAPEFGNPDHIRIFILRDRTVDQIEKDLADAREAFADLDSQMASVQEEIDRLEMEMRDLQDDATELPEKIERLERELEDVKTANDWLEVAA